MSTGIAEYSSGTCHTEYFSLEDLVMKINEKFKVLEEHFRKKNSPLPNELLSYFPHIENLLQRATTYSQQKEEPKQEDIRKCWRVFIGYQTVDALLRAGV